MYTMSQINLTQVKYCNMNTSFCLLNMLKQLAFPIYIAFSNSPSNMSNSDSPSTKSNCIHSCTVEPVLKDLKDIKIWSLNTVGLYMLTGSSVLNAEIGTLCQEYVAFQDKVDSHSSGL